jgi:hypothetical protein
MYQGRLQSSVHCLDGSCYFTPNNLAYNVISKSNLDNA